MLVKEFNKCQAHIAVYSNRSEMGQHAGHDIADKIRELQLTRPNLNIMFAAAPSQNEVLTQLLIEPGIDWTSICAFHMDEYIGIPAEHPAGFANFLKRAIFSILPFKQVFYIECSANDPDTEAKRYADILKKYPLDICILGIGENGHIAFNDPGVADFKDRLLVKVVKLDAKCRQQQVNDGCFDTITQVPMNAITVTIPELVSAPYLFCSVPGTRKAGAVAQMINNDISIDCPASILIHKENVRIYLDLDAAGKIL